MKEIIFLILAMIVGGVICFTIIFLIIAGINFVKISSVGTGTHSGFITAVDERGYLYKNYVVYFKTDNTSSQEDEYCIFREDEELIKKAKEASQNREQVVITYEGVRGFGYSICYGSQIKDIERI